MLAFGVTIGWLFPTLERYGLCSRRNATGIVLAGPWWIRFATIQP